jgi:glycosyltransferase involved in cell wall biosynthesis
MTAPLVSVVLPTYQRSHTVLASVESLLAQRGPEFEVVVVDDGSTDDTPAVLRALRDPRLRVLRIPHSGVAAARNAGIAASAAPLVAFHDSDDFALPGRLAVPAEFLESHPDIDLVIQNGRMLPAEDDETRREEPWIRLEVAATLAARPIGVAEVFRWNLGQLQGMTFRRRALDAVGPLDGTFSILDDLDLVLRVTTAHRAVFLDVPAFAYRRHAGGIARNRAVVREESIRLADKLVGEHPELLDVLGRGAFRKRQARRWARLAAARARGGDAAAARDALTRARRLDPANLRYRLRALWLRLRPGE